jgi:hypothetical protein
MGVLGEQGLLAGTLRAELADQQPGAQPFGRVLRRAVASARRPKRSQQVHGRDGCGLVMPGGMQWVVIDGARRGRTVSTL